MFCKKGLLKNFVTFTKNKLRQSLFLTKMWAFRPEGMKFVFKIFLSNLFLISIEIEKNSSHNVVETLFKLSKGARKYFCCCFKLTLLSFFHFLIFFSFLLLSLLIFSGKKRAITNSVL